MKEIKNDEKEQNTNEVLPQEIVATPQTSTKLGKQIPWNIIVIAILTSLVLWVGLYQVFSDNSSENQESNVTSGASIPIANLYPEGTEEETNQTTTTNDSEEAAELEFKFSGTAGKYVNSGLGLSFTYPKDWGRVAESINYGTEVSDGPRISLIFEKCLNQCEVVVAISSRNFGGIGSSMPVAVAGGFLITKDGEYIVYKPNNSASVYNDKNTINRKEINGGILVQYRDYVHDKNRTSVVFNVEDEVYKGIEFFALDEFGENTARATVESIAESFKVL